MYLTIHSKSPKSSFSRTPHKGTPIALSSEEPLQAGRTSRLHDQLRSLTFLCILALMNVCLLFYVAAATQRDGKYPVSNVGRTSRHGNCIENDSEQDEQVLVAVFDALVRLRWWRRRQPRPFSSRPQQEQVWLRAW